jgi:hypothetical protein
MKLSAACSSEKVVHTTHHWIGEPYHSCQEGTRVPCLEPN